MAYKSASELLKKLRKIEIKSRQISSNVMSGEYHSRFKGKGMHFSEVREYQSGDDIRSIDWKVTARYNNPYVKLYEEEREIVVMILVDVSMSNYFGTKSELKAELSTEIAALLSFAAIQNKDQIGVLFFSDKVEKLIPPQKGKKHVLRIIKELLAFKPVSKKTNIEKALKFLNNYQKKRSVVFLVSDFIDHNYEKSLKVSNSKHDLMCIKLFDKREETIDDVGFLKVKDLETGEEVTIDTSSKIVRKSYEKSRKTFDKKTNDLLKKNGIDFISCCTGEPYVLKLIKLFEKRR